VSFPKYAEQLEYISAVTKMLNEGPEAAHEVGYYIHVELREMDTHVKVGEWSDEIAGDCWGYDDSKQATA
jgi:hypothetical protein